MSPSQLYHNKKSREGFFATGDTPIRLCHRSRCTLRWGCSAIDSRTVEHDLLEPLPRGQSHQQLSVIIWAFPALAMQAQGLIPSITLINQFVTRALVVSFDLLVLFSFNQVRDEPHITIVILHPIHFPAFRAITIINLDLLQSHPWVVPHHLLPTTMRR